MQIYITCVQKFLKFYFVLLLLKFFSTVYSSSIFQK